jgi:3-oxoacyl-[acyl-carrier-protein] synthase II
VTRRVVVTGLGWVTPLGFGLEHVHESLVAGRSGVRTPAREVRGTPPVHAVGEVSAEDLAALARAHPEAAATGDVRTLFAASAAADALADADVGAARKLADADVGAARRLTDAHVGAARKLTDAGLAAGRGGVALASGPGVHRVEDVHLGLDAAGAFDPVRFHAARDRWSADSLLRQGASAPAAALARAHGLTGPVFAPITACAGGNTALGLALRAIRAGEADWMLAGGADSRIASIGLVWFSLLGAGPLPDGPPSQACRPFDRRRGGAVTGEGAGVVVLESEEHALERGARIRAEIAGYGASLGAYRATAPCPDGRGAAQAMARALADAGLAPEDVDLVNAHGTGTKRNDPAEVAAIKTVFGAHARRLAVPGLKSMLGHLLAASAAVAFASSVLSVERDVVPPTSTLREPDPACDLDHVPRVAQRRPVRAALVNAFAFGGNNACVALRKWTAAPSPRSGGRPAGGGA